MIPKEIMKLYEKLAFSRGYEEAFRDFLDEMCIRDRIRCVESSALPVLVV